MSIVKHPSSTVYMTDPGCDLFRNAVQLPGKRFVGGRDNAMKRNLVVCFMVVQSVCFGSVRDELERLKSLPVPEWAAVRDRILKEGPACTNELAEIRNRPQESWEVRFIASLCLERLLNDPEETDFFRNP